MMKKILFIGLLILGCLSLSAQSKLSLHTQKYISGGTEQTITTRTSGTTTVYIPAYIHVAPDMDLNVLEKLGVQVNVRVEGMVTAQIPVDRIEAVAGIEDVDYIQAAIPVYPMMDKVRQAVGVDRVHIGEGLSGPFFGKGVVVGIIDAGFDYTHPDFFDWDRKELRIKRVWEQNYTQGTPPEGFSYGGELKTQEDILKAAGDVNTNSHGTHVAGIAVGADKLDNDYYGIAGEAEIVLVSIGRQQENNVNLSDAIAYIYRYAESVGKPCVINMSLGTQAGPHDGTSAFDMIADQLQGEGRLLVGSVGNFGGGKFHASKTFVSAEDEPLKTFVDYKSKLSTTNVGGDIEIWGEPGMKYEVEVFTYDLSNQKILDVVIVDPSSAGEAPGEYVLKGATGKIRVFSEVNPLNNKLHVMVSSMLTGLRARHALGMNIIPRSEGIVHIWADDNYVNLTSNDLEGWTDGNDDLSLAEIGGTGNKIISVGAYVTRNSYQKEGSDKIFTLDETLDAIASFSSKGPTADGRIKPEITAPGCYIVSAVSSHDASLSSLDIASYGTWDDKNYYYAYMQGTSMAAPVVTGILAGWLQANPKLTPEEVRNILKKTAMADDYTGTLPGEGNSTWGYGKIDAWEGLKESLSMASSIQNVSTDGLGSILIGDGDCNYNLLFTKSIADVECAVYSVYGQIVEMRHVQSVNAGGVVNINLTDSPKGMYIIKVNSGQWQNCFKVVVE